MPDGSRISRRFLTTDSLQVWPGAPTSSPAQLNKVTGQQAGPEGVLRGSWGGQERVGNELVGR
eukprot:267664-Prorocentrum_minimum.AAC.1